MKERLDRHQERLSAEERQQLWEQVRPALSRGGRRQEAAFRRWTLSFGLAAVALIVAGLLFTRTEESRERQRAQRRMEILRAPGQGIPSGPAAPGQIAVEDPAPSSAAAYETFAAGGLRANPFRFPARDSVSAFGLVAGTESYAFATKCLEEGELPPADLIRVEEFVNAFGQEYPEFDSPEIRIFLEGGPSPLRPGCQLLRIGIKARNLPPAAHRQSNGGPGRAEEAGRIALAGNATARVVFDPLRVQRYRLLGFEPRPDTGAETRPRRTGADLAPGQEVTVLYELMLKAEAATGRVATVHVRFQRPAGEGGEEVAPDELTRSIQAPEFFLAFNSASPRFRLDATAVTFAEILHRSLWIGSRRFRELLPLARKLEEELRGDPAVAQFAALVERAAVLSGELPPPAPADRPVR